MHEQTLMIARRQDTPSPNQQDGGLLLLQWCGMRSVGELLSCLTTISNEPALGCLKFLGMSNLYPEKQSCERNMVLRMAARPASCPRFAGYGRENRRQAQGNLAGILLQYATIAVPANGRSKGRRRGRTDGLTRFSGELKTCGPAR